MGYSIKEITEIVSGELVLQASSLGIMDRIEHLLVDSRRIIYPETSVFIAIKGSRHDGHKYLQEVYDAGVRNFIVHRNYTIQQFSFPNDTNVIQVENALFALQSLAAYHRHQFSYPVVGITGSNGKTTVKEWLSQLLKDDVLVVRNPKSFNSQVGVPLSVWQMTGQHQIGIFEAGISEKGEMGRLQSIIDPQIGIFTYLGHAHAEGFSSISEKLHEKLELFKNAESLIYCRDHEEVEEGVISFLQHHKKLKIFTWSRTGINSDCNFDVELKQSYSFIHLKRGSQRLSVQIPFTDNASITNACSCFAFLVAVNRVSTDILKRFKELQPVEMRLQLKEGINNCVIINDSYNADVNALQIALDLMNQQSAGYTKTLILSDLLQTGMNEAELYAHVAGLIRQKGIKNFIGIGPQLSKFKNLFSGQTRFYLSTQAFIKSFKSLDFNQHIILLKGARVFKFEKISSLLEKKVHETVFEINLNSLVHNLNIYKTKIKPDVKLMAMVKAFSYGAGSYEIAKTLEFHRIDYLAVAYADEGVTLRKSGIKTPIMVMNPEPSGFDSIIQHNLEPELYNSSIFDQLIKACDGEDISIHIELECGMKRLGFDEHELESLLEKLKQNPNIRVRSVFAHLAASEEKKHDQFTKEQITRFKRMSDFICKSLDYHVIRHILNSSGIVRFPEAHFDMVRLGIGLYGIDPSEKIQKELQQMGTLKTVISQLRSVKSHETIGYSRRGTLKQDSIIATVAIGYADGLSRKLGNGKGYMMVNEKKAPIVGSICMDMTMLDVTGIDCKEGDEVIVFGKEPNVIDVANKIGTIPYEILTSVSQRVKRVYFFE